MLGYTPVPSACWDTPPCPVHSKIGMATAADGTHPTGMHSCLEFAFASSFAQCEFSLEKHLRTFQQLIVTLKIFTSS